MGSLAAVALKILILGNGMTMLTFGVGLLLVKGGSRAQRWGGVFFLSTAAAFMLAMAEAFGLHMVAPHILLVEFAFLSLSGSLLYAYLCRLVEPETTLGKRAWPLRVFPALYLAAMLPFYVLPGEAKIAVYDAFRSGERAGIRYTAALMVAPSLWVVACCAAFVARQAARTRSAGKPLDRMAKSLVALAALMGASAFVHALTLAFAFRTGIVILATTYAVLGAMLLVLRYPALLMGGRGPADPDRRGRSRLAGVDIGAVRASLESVMATEKPYLDETLALGDLSARLGLTAHQLSEFLNAELGSTFKAYVNGWRVREAERLVAEEPPVSMLDLAYACGFNSKSNFNKVFKETTGLTPSEYLAAGGEERAEARRRAGAGPGVTSP